MQNIKGTKSFIRIRAVGDLSPGDYAGDGRGVGALTSKYGCNYPFINLSDFSGSPDILIANLEGVLSARCRRESLRFGGLPEMAEAIRTAGFNVVSLANNHAFDHGAEVLQETIDYCFNAGLKVCGLRGDGDYYSKPVYITRKNFTVGILAYNWVGLVEQMGVEQYLAVVDDGVVNYTWCRDTARDQLNRQNIQEKNLHVIRDIEKLKKEVDIVVLLPHWGYEWTIYPPYGVLLEARAFIDAGVDLIIGSHPHVAQGIERYKEKIIAYSLGNFLFDPQPEKQFSGMVFDCKIKKSGDLQFNYFAVQCDELCQPEYAPEQEQRKFKQRINQSTKAILSETAEKELDDELIYKKFEKGYNYRKIKKVKYLFFTALKHPSMIKPIFFKVLNLIELVILRLKGQKVRW